VSSGIEGTLPPLRTTNREDSMRIGLSTICALAAAALACCGTAGADSSAPGTPGAANCFGQTRAFLNNLYQTELDVTGLGNIARFNNMTVPNAQDNVRSYCAAVPS
jgi:hypothetical protein